MKRDALLAVGVALVAAIAFAAALPGPWIYDDHALIETNPYVHDLGHAARWLTHDFWDVGGEMLRFENRMLYWRPLVTASFAVDWQLGGGTPLPFHATNTVLHALAAALAFVTLRRWIGQTAPAAIAALLFALHATKAESVAWISGRTDILCTLWILVASLGIARRLRGDRGGIALEAIATVLAYATKELAIVLPALAMIEAWVAAPPEAQAADGILGRRALDRAMVRRALRAAAPQLVVACAYLGLRAALLPIRPAEATGVDLGLVDHVQLVLETLGRYVALTVAPSELSLQHGLVRWDHGHLAHSTTHVVIGAVAACALVVAIVWARRRRPWLAIGLGLYLVALAPASNLVFSQMGHKVWERMLYLPMLGVAFVVGAGLVVIPDARRRLVSGVLVALIVVHGLHAALRSWEFTDEAELWERELRVRPDSIEARRFLYGAAARTKQWDAALAHLLAIQREQARGSRTRSMDLELAADVVSVVVRRIPDMDDSSLDLIDAFCASLLDRPDTAATLALPDVVFELPGYVGHDRVDLREARPRLLLARAELANRRGDDGRAVELAAQAAASCPGCATVRVRQAQVLARAGRYAEALAVVDALPSTAGAAATTRKLIDRAADTRSRADQVTGPQQLQLRALELAGLELWGRAYEVLDPHREQIVAAPRAALGFAELAYRAGAKQVAREIASLHLAPDEVEPTLATWAAAMGWTHDTR